MSGKAPPRGPRALLNQLPTVASSSSPISPSFPVASSSKLSTSNPLAPSNSMKAITRAGVAPPTGPRSLMNGNQSSHKNQLKPYVNGFTHSPTTNSATNANSTSRYNPNATGSISASKGKAVDNSYTNDSSDIIDQPSISSSIGFTAVNGRKAPPTGPSALTDPTTSFTSHDRPISPTAIRPTTLFKQPAPPPLSPPPPPPSDTPPPPPPPLSVNHVNPKNSVSDKLPHLDSPLKLRFTQAHEPKQPPPPLPPPLQVSTPPPPPPPPSSTPPALPPPLRRDTTFPTITLPPRPAAPIPQLPPRPLSTFRSPSFLTPPSFTPPQPLSRPPSGTFVSNDARFLSSPQPSQQPPPVLLEVVEPVIPDYVEVTTKVVNGILTKFYSLKPLPPWPPSSSAFPPGRNFKLLYDPAVDKDRYGKYSEIIELVRHAISKSSGDKDASESVQNDDAKEQNSIGERLKGKAKGRELLFRYNGETLPGETPAVPKDPRKAQGFKRTNKIREDYYIPIYPHDSNSPGPPPATTVLILHLPVLVPNAQIRRHFSIYGKIMSFDPEIDRATGAALGIVSITFLTHEEAKKCVASEDGKKFGEASKGMGLGIGAGLNGEQEMRVVLDGEGKKVKEVLKEIEERKRKELEEKKRREKEKEAMLAANVSGSGGVRQSNLSVVHLNGQASTPDSWRNQQQAGPSSLAPPMHMNGRPHQTYPPRGHASSGPSSLFRARGTNLAANNGLPSRPPLPDSIEIDPTSTQSPHSSESTPIPPQAPSFIRDRYRQTASRNFATNFSHNTPISASPRALTRSPSPVSRRPGQFLRAQYEKDVDHREVMEELARNGFDHVRIDAAQVGSGAREEDVRSYFEGLKVDKVLRDRNGWYVTFKTSDSARRAEMVLGVGNRLLANRTVTISVHGAPSKSEVKAEVQSTSQAIKQTRVWSDVELVNSAEKIIAKELKVLLEKDVTDRVAGVHIRKLIVEEKNKKVDEKDKVVASAQVDSRQPVVVEKKGLQGLSFRKRRQDVKATVEVSNELDEAQPSATVVEESHPSVNNERPKKKPKLDNKKVLPREDVESEDEDGSTTLVSAAVSSSTETGPKRSLTPDLISDDIEKPPKKLKLDDDRVPSHTPEVETKKEIVKKTNKKVAKRSKKAKTVEPEVVTDVIVPPIIEPPSIAEVHLTPPPIWDSSLSPSLSPIPPETKARPAPAPPPVQPTLDPIKEGICADDEDLYFAKLALQLRFDKNFVIPGPIPSDPNAPPPFRKNVTGSARTEGYYKISHAEKQAYVAQYALRANPAEAVSEAPIKQASQVMSSRSNRANARRRAQGIEEINQVQLALALSKGETGATELVKYNQLQTRKKHLRFARSPIHAWGLYAMERISRGEMVIEYVGEIIRAAVADKREKAYERQGIGSSYLFRIDEDLVVDATKKGNLGRLINHSCDPNCTAKIITINGEKKIVIYAKQDIELGDEITYDYHFPIEQDKIPCLCGSAKCRGYLN